LASLREGSRRTVRTRVEPLAVTVTWMAESAIEVETLVKALCGAVVRGTPEAGVVPGWTTCEPGGTRDELEGLGSA
jgi:hypothetical protein